LPTFWPKTSPFKPKINPFEAKNEDFFGERAQFPVSQSLCLSFR